MNNAKLSPLAEAKMFRADLEDGFSIEQIAKRTGRSVAKINERLRLFNLDPALIKRCDGDFDYVAQEIARIADFAGQRKAVKAWEARPDKSTWGFKFLKEVVAEQMSKKTTLATTEDERAWARQHRAAEGIVVAPNKPAVAPSRILETAEVGHMVSIYIDDAKIGCGERTFIVTDMNDKTVKLYSASLLRDVTVTRGEFDKYAKPFKATLKVVESLNRNCTTFDRLDLEYSPAVARKARKVVEMAVAA